MLPKLSAVLEKVVKTRGSLILRFCGPAICCRALVPGNSWHLLRDCVVLGCSLPFLAMEYNTRTSRTFFFAALLVLFLSLLFRNMATREVPKYHCMPDNKGALATPPWSNEEFFLRKMQENVRELFKRKATPGTFPPEPGCCCHG